MNMKLSIITVSYNSAATIEDTIKSVLGQTHEDVEYIIVDGGSTDGTVDIIERYADRGVARWTSGPDRGIYDAMNKGIGMATGEVVGILNSDDVYYDRDVLTDVAAVFVEKKVESCYGDLVYMDKGLGRVVRRWVSEAYKDGLFEKGWSPPHPSFFVRRQAYERYGLFDPGFSLAADYELMLRFIRKHRVSTAYIPRVLVKMRVGGASNRSLLNIARQNVECYRAWKHNGMCASPAIIIRKLASRLRQFTLARG